MPVDVVAEDIGDEDVDSAGGEKTVGDDGVALLAEEGGSRSPEFKRDSAGGELAGGGLLAAVKGVLLAGCQTAAAIRRLIKERLYRNDDGSVRTRERFLE
jgi:hypothetical protein